MALFGKSDDKIRVQCAGCGRRLKFPRSALGKTFRCPACSTLVITSERQTSRRPAEAPPQQKAASAARRALKSWKSGALMTDKNRALEKLSALLQQEEARTVERATQILAAGGAETERTRRLESLRQEKSVRVRHIMERFAGEIKAEMSLLTREAAKSPDKQRLLAAKTKELGELDLFGKVMFDLPGGWSRTASAAQAQADGRRAGPTVQRA